MWEIDEDNHSDFEILLYILVLFIVQSLGL